MGVEAGHTDVGLLNAKLTAGIVNEFYALNDAGLLYQVASLAQRHMGRDVDDADVLVSQHHGIFLCIRKRGVNLCMSIIVMAR